MMARWRFPKWYADRVARLRVPGGFLLVAAFAWAARPSAESLLWGVPVSLAGLAVRAWAAGHLEKNRQLATGGPYAAVRNPLYVGTVLVAAGLVIAARHPGLGVLFAAVFLLVYLPVIQLEEEHLRKLFPAYEEYARQVPVLWPRWPKPWPRERFRFRQYWRNREYQALLGYAAGLAWLCWRAWAA